MEKNQNKPATILNKRLLALARLGLVVTTVYSTPVLMKLNGASASGAISYARDALTITECGACHSPYSPIYLPAYSWAKIMDNLENHFGEDASLDKETRNKIKTYMIGRRSTAIPLRITKRNWFIRRHKKVVNSKTLKAAGSMSNCTSCHQR